MDNYREEIVVKNNRTLNNVLYALLMVLMVFSGAMALLNLSSITVSGNILGSIIYIVAYGGIAFLIWWKKDILKTEYEYTFTNGELDFATVMSNRKRKELGSMRVKNVEAFGAVSSGSFNRFVNMPGLKKSNWFLNRDGNLHFFYYQKEGTKKMIIFEPSDEMVQMIKIYLPHGVYQIN